MEANIEGLDPEVSPSSPSAPQPETEAESSVRKTEHPKNLQWWFNKMLYQQAGTVQNDSSEPDVASIPNQTATDSPHEGWAPGEDHPCPQSQRNSRPVQAQMKNAGRIRMAKREGCALKEPMPAFPSLVFPFPSAFSFLRVFAGPDWADSFSWDVLLGRQYPL